MPSVVTIGLQQSYYSTVEGQSPVDVCVSVLSGDITGSNFVVSYSTSDGVAEGMYRIAIVTGINILCLYAVYTQHLVTMWLRVDH